MPAYCARESKMGLKPIPFDECVESARKWVEMGQTVHQRFACEKCGNDTLGIEKPNTFYEQGECDRCKHITDLRKTGCNYLLVARL